MHPAQMARERKERNPEFYCRRGTCLFRTFNAVTGETTPCPKHGARTEREPMTTSEAGAAFGPVMP